MNLVKISFKRIIFKKYKYILILLALVQIKMIYEFFSPGQLQLIYSFDGKLPYLDFSFLQKPKHQVALQWFIGTNLKYIYIGIALYFIERENHLKGLRNQLKTTMREMKK